MCLSVSKLCSHLEFVAAVGEVRFMIGMPVLGKLYHRGSAVAEWLECWT